MDAPEAERTAPQPVEFPEQPDAPQEPTELDVEREKHRRRAEKFGVEYVEPAKVRDDLRMLARKEKFKREGFATGMDLFSQEEVEKRAQRAARFGTAGQGLQWAPPEVPEDEAKRRQRAERFGGEYVPRDNTGLMDVDLFEQRRDPGPGVERRPDAIHLYGVDLLSTKDCLSYFADYGPTFVEWINDSSCNVAFSDGATARRALAGTGRPLPPDEAPGGAHEGMPDVSSPAAIDFLWHKGRDFQKGGSDIPIILRMATVEDVKPAGRVQSRHLWQGAGGRGRGRGRGRGGRRGRMGEGAPEEGGDVEMRGAGGQRKRQRKRRRGGDVEMADAPEEPDLEALGQPVAQGDLRARLGGRRQRTAGLFSTGDGPGDGPEGAGGLPGREQVDYGDL